MDPVAWVNGDLRPLREGGPSLASSTFHMGTGVFDGLMAYWNDDHYRLHRAGEHLRRFAEGARRMDLAFEWPVEELEEGVRAVLAALPPRTYYVRPIAFRGGPEIMLVASRSIPVDVGIFAVPAERDDDRPLRCVLSSVRRVSSDAIPVAWKICGTYANSFLAQQEALAAGCDAALMLSADGRLSEAPTSNVFLIDGDELVTPALDADVFPGITRRMIFELAERLGVRVTERDVWPHELASFAGAFVCSTLMEVRPIASIGPHAFGTADHPVFAALLEQFRAATHR